MSRGILEYVIVIFKPSMQYTGRICKLYRYFTIAGSGNYSEYSPSSNADVILLWQLWHSSPAWQLQNMTHPYQPVEQWRSDEHPQVIIRRTPTGRGDAFEVSMIGVRAELSSPRDQPYYTGFIWIASREREALPIAVWWCARRTCSTKESVVGGRDFSLGVVVIFVFAILNGRRV